MTECDEDPTPIRKCVCFDTTFETIWEVQPSSLGAIATRFGCGSDCGMCRPYLAKMLRTGLTAFPADDLGDPL